MESSKRNVKKTVTEEGNESAEHSVEEIQKRIEEVDQFLNAGDET